MKRAVEESLRDAGLLALRVGFGGLMFFGHGLGKLGRIGSDGIAGFPDPLGIGNELSFYATASSEGVLTVLIVLGLATRAAAIPLCFTMLVAALVIHGVDPLFPDKEFPLMYAFGFGALIFTGPGRISLDGWLRRKQPDEV